MAKVKAMHPTARTEVRPPLGSGLVVVSFGRTDFWSAQADGCEGTSPRGYFTAHSINFGSVTFIPNYLHMIIRRGSCIDAGYAAHA